MSLKTTRPVAVLLGWLGCRPQSLRRYVQLYDSNGWDSIIRIATPESIVAAVLRGPSVEQSVALQNQRPPSDTHETGGELSTKDMQRFAWEILDELQTRQCPRFVVHIFSNGGCFLWEWIRYFLFQQHRYQQLKQPHVAWNNSNIHIHNLQRRLVGRVFDSAPAHYAGATGGIEAALQHITPLTEKSRLLGLAKKMNSSQVKVRHDEFWNNLCHDTIAVPELYLYSETDRLTAYGPLEKLMEQRKHIVGEEHVWTHNFLDSEHCCHLLKYPEKYEDTLGKFLLSCSSHVNEMDEESNSECAVISKM